MVIKLNDNFEEIKNSNKTIIRNRLIERADRLLDNEKKLVFLERGARKEEGKRETEITEFLISAVGGKQEKPGNLFIYVIVAIVVALGILIDIFALW